MLFTQTLLISTTFAFCTKAKLNGLNTSTFSKVVRSAFTTLRMSPPVMAAASMRPLPIMTPCKPVTLNTSKLPVQVSSAPLRSMICPAAVGVSDAVML